MNFTKKISYLIIFSAVFSLASCGYGKYNASSAVSDKKVEYENSRVYGDGKGEPARQTKQTYPAPDSINTRIGDIKEKLYGKPKDVESEETDDDVTKPDSTDAKLDTLKVDTK